MEKTIITITVENGDDVRDIVKELVDGDLVLGRVGNCMIKIQRIDNLEQLSENGEYNPAPVAGEANDA